MTLQTKTLMMSRAKTADVNHCRHDDVTSQDTDVNHCRHDDVTGQDTDVTRWYPSLVPRDFIAPPSLAFLHPLPPSRLVEGREGEGQYSVTRLLISLSV